jgi:hypothetical protein
MHNGRLGIDTRHWQVERQETEDSIGDRDRGQYRGQRQGHEDAESKEKKGRDAAKATRDNLCISEERQRLRHTWGEKKRTR